MARHGGFGVAATVSEQTANEILRDSVLGASAGALFLPLIGEQAIEGQTVGLTGVLRLEAPVVHFHDNADGLVEVFVTFSSTAYATLNGKTYGESTFTLTASATVGLDTNISPTTDQVVLGVDSSRLTFESLDFMLVIGQELPHPVVLALTSADTVSQVNDFVHTLPGLVVSFAMMSRTLNFKQPFPTAFEGIRNQSQFLLFQFTLSASRVEYRVLDGAVTVGAEFIDAISGQSVTSAHGDINQLVNLVDTPAEGERWTYTITQQAWEQGLPYEPYITPSGHPSGGNIAITVNMELMKSVAAIASKMMQGLWVEEHTRFVSMDLDYSPFDKPLYPGTQDGLAVKLVLDNTYAGRTSAAVYVQAYREVPANSPWIERWLLYPALVDISTPVWIDFLALGLGIMLPFIAAAVGLVVLKVAEIVESAEDAVRAHPRRIEVPAPDNGKLTGDTGSTWHWGVNYASFCPSSYDTAYEAMPVVLTGPIGGIVCPLSWSVYNNHPITPTFKLRDDFAAQYGPQVVLDWEVRRGDTNELLLRETKEYGAAGGNGVAFHHMTRVLYLVQTYKISVRVRIKVANQVGTIGYFNSIVSISDPLDRHHKFVHWGPYPVWFQNAGTTDAQGQMDVYKHIRRSKIHRVAVFARCNALKDIYRRRGDGVWVPDWQYFDELPFPAEHADRPIERRMLCDYCFFGGPDKHTLRTLNDVPPPLLAGLVRI
ncbi:hypothetical protein [Burkholderia cenocepacia]|uniref:hypothetical protein n=1 Tax=Burkholderia cenocepacia TaxID=95486 RepID=UPI0007610096|nr:hypothetical protein [Burkholderia cenocepacia]KWU26425.1 hypothetical protein AS149_25900 [Burkholderia cenocepacia]